MKVELPAVKFTELLAEHRMYGDLTRPEFLPRPSCRVMLICGPPAAGKSTYVREHAAPSDSVIDLDLIACELGYGRDRPPDVTTTLLTERNQRLARLAQAPREHVAWVILTAASAKLRSWWCDRLRVAPCDMVLLMPTQAELVARIRRDPERASVRELHEKLVADWFVRERNNIPSRILRGCDAAGWPRDPLHNWNDDEDEESYNQRPRRRRFRR